MKLLHRSKVGVKICYTAFPLTIGLCHTNPLVGKKKSAQSPYHGFTDDGSDVPEGRRLTKEQKNQILELMLGQIANVCPDIARITFIKDSKSLDDTWQKIHLHLGFQRTGAHFLDLATLTLEPNERSEALHQHINAFYQDNLLTPQSAITHHGDKITVEEDMTPSLENTVFFCGFNAYAQDYQPSLNSGRVQIYVTKH